jgi:WD40 repeat protein
MQILKVFLILLLLTSFNFAQADLEQNALRFKARIGFTAPDDHIFGQKFLEDERKVLLVGKKTIQIWDVADGKLLEEHPHEIQKLNKLDTVIKFSPDGRRGIVLDSFSFRVFRKQKKVSAGVYDLQTGKLITILERPNESIREAMWSENGKTLITYSSDYNDKRTELCFWDGETLALRSAVMLKGDLDTPYLSRNGKRLVTSTEKLNIGIFASGIPERRTIVWNTETGKVEQSIKLPDGESPNVWTLLGKISRDEKFFAETERGTLYVWEIGGGDMPKYEIKPTKKDELIGLKGFSDDGKYLIAHQNKAFEFYQAATGKLEFSMPNLKYGSDIRLLEDGKTLLVDNCENAAVYDLPSRQKLYEIDLVCKTEDDFVSTSWRDFDIMRFHPDGKLLLTFSDKTVRVWNARNGALVQTIVDPNRIENKKKDKNKDDGLGWNAGWLMKGEYLYASGADEKTILLWQMDKNFNP